MKRGMRRGGACRDDFRGFRTRLMSVSSLAEIGLVLALILANGALALSELAIVSSRPSRLKPLADRQVPGAAAALALAAEPGRFLSAVQVGISLVGVLS